MKIKIKFIQVLFFGVLMVSCNPSQSSSDLKSTNDETSLSDLNDQIHPEKLQSLAWEKTVPNSSSWSNYIYKVILSEEPQMFDVNSANDVELFCPKYRQLDETERLNFWGQLFAAMSFHESRWDPIARMIESTMGIDPITGRQVASEGLLQMSYQDVPNYGNVCEFNWELDKHLEVKNPNRTILDPFKNLRCGIKIMAKQISRYNRIAIRSGAYWAVIIPGGRYNKINEISKMVKQLSFCR